MQERAITAPDAAVSARKFGWSLYAQAVWLQHKDDPVMRSKVLDAIERCVVWTPWGVA